MANIHLVITSANIAEAYEKRKLQYLESFKSCLQYSHLYTTYTVLECVSQNEPYLNPYNTFYSKEGNTYLNKGLNEMTHLRSFLKQSPFSDNDAIVKLTGRYLLEDSSFLEKVHLLHDDFDALFKDDSDVYVGRGYHTFFYYLKKHTFMEIAEAISYTQENDRPIEWDFKDYLYDNPRCATVDRLGLRAFQGTHSEKIFSC